MHFQVARASSSATFASLMTNEAKIMAVFLSLFPSRRHVHIGNFTRKGQTKLQRVKQKAHN